MKFDCVAFDIEYDVDVEEDRKELPSMLVFTITSDDVDGDFSDDRISEYLSEAISNKTGFCHKGFEFLSVESEYE